MIALTVEPIGIVRGGPADEQQVIEVYSEHAAGLHRIEELDELWVFYLRTAASTLGWLRRAHQTWRGFVWV